LPIVATNVDGAAEAITHGENGLLAAPLDVDALARHVLALLGNDEQRRAMGRRGQERVAEFSQERMIAELGAWYAEVVRRPRPRLPTSLRFNEHVG